MCRNTLQTSTSANRNRRWNYKGLVPVSQGPSFIIEVPCELLVFASYTGKTTSNDSERLLSLGNIADPNCGPPKPSNITPLWYIEGFKGIPQLDSQEARASQKTSLMFTVLLYINQTLNYT